jgi:hypothetical protein
MKLMIIETRLTPHLLNHLQETNYLQFCILKSTKAHVGKSLLQLLLPSLMQLR